MNIFRVDTIRCSGRRSEFLFCLVTGEEDIGLPYSLVVLCGLVAMLLMDGYLQAAEL